jgi:hypothetical protein
MSSTGLPFHVSAHLLNPPFWAFSGVLHLFGISIREGGFRRIEQ